ncbi:MAG: helix-turn-helix domain-containing protein [Allosphingosinicella sp.]|uniref:AlbA family DNA-binding domain-containing protein n=1 Tax=Allosphingosinicella sp. TaxID=2823234 RepID=UPI0039510D3A
MDSDQALSLIAGGESLTLELKASLSSRKPEGICKEIAALATSKGGHLLVGVSDDLQVIGVLDAVTIREDRTLDCRPCRANAVNRSKGRCYRRKGNRHRRSRERRLPHLLL